MEAPGGQEIQQPWLRNLPGARKKRFLRGMDIPRCARQSKGGLMVQITKCRLFGQGRHQRRDILRHTQSYWIWYPGDFELHGFLTGRKKDTQKMTFGILTDSGIR